MNKKSELEDIPTAVATAKKSYKKQIGRTTLQKRRRATIGHRQGLVNTSMYFKKSILQESIFTNEG